MRSYSSPDYRRSNLKNSKSHFNQVIASQKKTACNDRIIKILLSVSGYKKTMTDHPVRMLAEQ
jgi:hypothetical protein